MSMHLSANYHISLYQAVIQPTTAPVTEYHYPSTACLYSSASLPHLPLCLTTLLFHCTSTLLLHCLTTPVLQCFTTLLFLCLTTFLFHCLNCLTTLLPTSSPSYISLPKHILLHRPTTSLLPCFSALLLQSHLTAQLPL